MRRTPVPLARSLTAQRQRVVPPSGRRRACPSRAGEVGSRGCTATQIRGVYKGGSGSAVTPAMLASGSTPPSRLPNTSSTWSPSAIFVIASADGLAECWVLSAGPGTPETIGSDPGPAPPVRLPLSVRLPAIALLWLFILVAVGAPLQAAMGALGSWLSVVAVSFFTTTVWHMVKRRATQLGRKPRTDRTGKRSIPTR